MSLFFFFQAEDGIRDGRVTGVQTCALPIYVRPFQVLRPRRGQRVEALVQRLEGGSLLWRHLAGGHDDEVDVAVLVRIADGERSLQVRADEVPAEHRSGSVDELGEELIQVGERSCVIHRGKGSQVTGRYTSRPWQENE